MVADAGVVAVVERSEAIVGPFTAERAWDVDAIDEDG
jgi:hypothetical protein